jgi:hypothetical protein
MRAASTLDERGWEAGLGFSLLYLCKSVPEAVNNGYLLVISRVAVLVAMLDPRLEGAAEQQEVRRYEP